MKHKHFDAIRPVCPVCRPATSEAAATIPAQQFPLQLGTVCEERRGEILQGILVCPNPACCREFPIVDGIPFLVADLKSLMAGNLWQILLRTDLAEPLESLIGDACGAGSSLDSTRQHLSAYAWDHYAEFDPQEDLTTSRPGNVARLVETGWSGVAPADLDPSPGVLLDLGCATGRSTFELASRFPDRMVIGIDLNISMLRLAATAMRLGTVRYPRRRMGMVYDRREFPVRFDSADRVDFWACDAGVLPFANSTAAVIQSLNLLDCLPSPLIALQEITRVMNGGGYAWLTSPFDWNPAATPMENWLGGHSQRGPGGGDGVSLLRSLVQPGQHPQGLPDIQLVRDHDHLTWRVRCHERSQMEYSAYGVLLQKQAGT